MRRATRIPGGLVAAAFLTNCGVDELRVCRAPSEAEVAELPHLLSQTGLYTNISQQELSADVHPFKPQFELWSDGAAKRRWIFLPPNGVIDSSNPDEWQFPPGTKIWKEFVRDHVRVETRLLQKVGPNPGDWRAMAYAWQPNGVDAVSAPQGYIDAGSTQHDVPSAGECWGCHGGRQSRVLGFSAIQLAQPAAGEGMNINRLVQEERLSHPLPPAREIPGNAVERAVLGYLHANCSHCHNQTRPGPSSPRCFEPRNELDFGLRLQDLTSVERTATYRSAIGNAVKPGRPDKSELLNRVQSRNDPYFRGMPPLGTENVHSDAVTLLRKWIKEMNR